MIDYEILLMLDPELPDERQEEIVKRVRGLVEKGGGTWEGQDPWGRRRLAYEIDKKTDGVYHLIHLSCPPETPLNSAIASSASRNFWMISRLERSICSPAGVRWIFLPSCSNSGRPA